MSMMATVEQVRAGCAVPFGPNGECSAIAKKPIFGQVVVAAEGIRGDEQGDTRHHGGIDKALHHYPANHYECWQAEGVRKDGEPAGPGAFGENLVTRGVTERGICIGDVVRLGAATVQVSQARQPCWRLNVRFDDPAMARRVQDTRRTGWYYRVLEPGCLAAGDGLELIERPHPDWPLSRILELFYGDPLNRAELEMLCAIPELADSWRALVQRRLERGRVEDWERRLVSPAS